MAKELKLGKGKDFTFPAPGKGGGEAKYPWDAWLDGKLLLLEQSEGTVNEKGTVEAITAKKDYEVDTNGMIPKLKSAARRRYKVVQISRLDAEGKKLRNALIIRARDMTPSERDDEDLLRVEEKDANDARKRARKAATSGSPATLGMIATA